MLRQYIFHAHALRIYRMYRAPCYPTPCTISLHPTDTDQTCSAISICLARTSHTAHTPRLYIIQDVAALTVWILYVCDFTVSLSCLLSGEGNKFLMSLLFPFSSSRRNAVRTYFINIMLFRSTSSSFTSFPFRSPKERIHTSSDSSAKRI